MKRAKVLLTMLLVVMLLAGCHKTVSYGFKMDNGDYVIIRVDKEYTLTQEESYFTITDEADTVVMKGFFTNDLEYEGFLQAVNRENCTIIDREPIERLAVTQYQYVTDKKTENNYICWLEGGQTGIVFSSMRPLEEADKVFDALDIFLDD